MQPDGYWKSGEVFMRKVIRGAVLGTVAALALGINVSPASAAGATSCPSDGYITRGDRCTKLSNGILSVRTVSAGNYVAVNYYRTGGSTLTAKLGYERNGSNTWSGFITMNQTPFHYERSWSPSASCSVVYGKLLTSGGTTYVTPAADPC
jgi:hypothetical protein